MPEKKEVSATSSANQAPATENTTEACLYRDLQSSICVVQSSIRVVLQVTSASIQGAFANL